MKRAIRQIVLVCIAGGFMGGMLGPGQVRAGDAKPRVGSAGKDAEGTPVLMSEAGSDGVVARVNGKPITLAEFQKPLLESYGLKILSWQVQLMLAKQEAERLKISFTQADVDAEMERTLKTAFADAPKADYPQLLEQLLEKKGVTQFEFESAIAVNAALRKIAEPKVKELITPEALKEAFDNMYGQTVVIRHIQVSNLSQVGQAKTRIAAGEKFEDVAATLSQNGRTAPLGGQLPPFSRTTVQFSGNMGKVPQSFKDWAFSSRVGDVSDPIQAEGGYHILKLEQKLEPKVVKFDDVKEVVRKELEEKLMEQGINVLRGQLAALARNTMKIEEPTLRKQFEDKLAEQKKQAEGADRIRKETAEKIRAAATQPGAAANLEGDLKPIGTPAPAGDATSPAKAPPGEQPPATKSAGGADSVPVKPAK